MHSNPFSPRSRSGREPGLDCHGVWLRQAIRRPCGHSSEQGLRTTVKIYFPRYHGDAVIERRDDGVDAKPRVTTKEVVLVVEDEPVVRGWSSRCWRNSVIPRSKPKMGRRARDPGSARSHRSAAHRCGSAGNERPPARRRGPGAASRFQGLVHDRLCGEQDIDERISWSRHGGHRQAVRRRSAWNEGRAMFDG